jgi:hypothetical protein
MRRNVVAACLFILFSACSDYNPAVVSDLGLLTGVSVSYTCSACTIEGSLPPGRSTPFIATARYLYGGQDVSAHATWQSSNTGIATVSPAGVVTGVAPGSVVITATFQGMSGSLNATISF